MTTEASIAALIEEPMKGMGYELVRVQISGAANRATLQVMAERLDGVAMTIDDCTEISRALSPILDVADPIAGAYALEVSSPGIDRPLVRPKDFERWSGFEAKLETRAPVDGRKRFKGLLMGLDGDEVLIRDESGADLRVPISALAKAKLVLNDALIKHAMQQQGQL
ncbi:Ribosome maturation factor RimP [Rhodospirillaceae bacterium LM-1]|nr:Ribosome maturation factor RimP [Rhodospirillaceae bacterium LM-1]